MKKLVFLLILFLFPKAFAQKPEVNIIPQPAEIQVTGGTLTLDKVASVSYDSQEASGIADMLTKRLNAATGYAVKSVAGSNGSIKLNINKSADPKLGKEGYTLSSTAQGISITANETPGLFYGVQTLLQLLPPEIESKTPVNITWTVPFVSITDYPRFAWRGMMLDVSRNFFTKEEVKLFLDEIARYKYNTFHWHLSDDNGWRIEIKSLPKLTSVGAWRVPRYGQFGNRQAPKKGEAATVGGFYTQDDVREIVKYAQNLNITIVPEIDVPGHSMAAIAAYPEISCTKDPETRVNPGSSFSEWFDNGTFKMNLDNTLNPSDEKVYEFLDKVFTEMAPLFPGQYIHVGGDECYKGFWMKDAGCQALMKKMKMSKPEELQAYFMKKVEQILKTKGKKMIGWDEILEGGLAPEATVMSWRGIKGGIEAAKMGHNVVMTPTTFAYLDYQQGEQTVESPMYASLRLNKCYSFNPVPEGVDAKYILGGQGNLWCEQIVTMPYVEYMIWPRGWALAEDFWSPDATKNWDSFIQRVEKHFIRAEKAGVNYSTAIYDPVINIKKSDNKLTADITCEAPGLDVYYTLDGSMPGIYSPKYNKPIDIPDGPVTLKLAAYRNGKQIGHLISLKPADLKNRE